jgi:hypothetical protein
MLATASVIAGAPLFSSGLHALRLRRELGRVRETRFADAPNDAFAQLCGVVSLESPLFGPLSGLPCAGFDLEIRGIGAPVDAVVAERRSFRLEGDDGIADVVDPIGPWDVAISAERVVGADEGITAGIAALLARAPEALWWRRAGGRLSLVERALPAGARAWVIGRARVAPRGALAELRRTGTDAAAWTESTEGARVSFGTGDHLGWMRISDHAPDRGRLQVPLVRSAGVVLGPVIGFLGMLYLAFVANHALVRGWF